VGVAEYYGGKIKAKMENGDSNRGRQKSKMQVLLNVPGRKKGEEMKRGGGCANRSKRLSRSIWRHWRQGKIQGNAKARTIVSG